MNCIGSLKIMYCTYIIQYVYKKNRSQQAIVMGCRSIGTMGTRAKVMWGAS